MKEVYGVNFKSNTNEESLPGFDSTFPCITSCYNLREGTGAPWHWHETAELFYIEEGTLEYHTPSEHHIFTGGCGGFVNCFVPHSTRATQVLPGHRQLLHLFDPKLISGCRGSRIDRDYVLPLTAAPSVELLAFTPSLPEHQGILRKIRGSFSLSPDTPAYELHLRGLLSEIWIDLLDTAAPKMAEPGPVTDVSRQIRQILIYVQEHYPEKITAADLAKAARVSERTCFQLFKERLHSTPMKYVQEFRLRTACDLLTQSSASVTEIGAACGLGCGSYFARVFRQYTGMTPLEYRTLSKHQQKGSF